MWQDTTMIPDSYLNIQIPITKSREHRRRPSIYYIFVWGCVGGLFLCASRMCNQQSTVNLGTAGGSRKSSPRNKNILNLIWCFQGDANGVAGSSPSVCMAMPLCMCQDTCSVHAKHGWVRSNLQKQILPDIKNAWFDAQITIPVRSDGFKRCQKGT